VTGHGSQAAGYGPHLPGRVPVQRDGHRPGPGPAQAQQDVQVECSVQSAAPRTAEATTGDVLSGQQDGSESGEAGAPDEKDGVDSEQDQQAAESPRLKPVSGDGSSEADYKQYKRNIITA
jgi:hypothetical protein